MYNYIDCHTHSEYSFDSTETLSEMIIEATQKDVKILTVTDHCELDLAYDIDNIIGSVQSVREHNGANVFAGVEVGQPLANAYLCDKLLKLDLDLVLASIHTLKDGTDFYMLDYSKMSYAQIDRMLENYFFEMKEVVQWDKYDILAHITYPYRYIIKNTDYNNFPLLDDEIERIFKTVISNGKGIELNTASLIMSELDFQINVQYLKLYKKLGGTILSVGSDAHTASDIARGYDMAYEVIKEIGYNHLTYYDKRKAVNINIE